jgi:hypothetical protein
MERYKIKIGNTYYEVSAVSELEAIKEVINLVSKDKEAINYILKQTKAM